MNIPFVDLIAQYQSIKPEIDEAVAGDGLVEAHVAAVEELHDEGALLHDVGEGRRGKKEAMKRKRARERRRTVAMGLKSQGHECMCACVHECYR